SSGTGGSQVYWNGSTWGGEQTWNSVTVAASWNYTAPSLIGGKNYYLRMRVTDAAQTGGNSFVWAVSTFTLDTTAPSIVLTSPVNNAFYSGVQVSTPFTGTSNDPGTNPTGVSTVTIAITDVDGGPSYFNGTSFVGGGPFFLPAQGTVANWSYNN